MNPWTSRLWRWLLLAYPAEFRHEYGPEMTEAFAGRWHEERGASRVWFCTKAAADVMLTAWKERYHIMIRDLKYTSFRRLAAHPGITAVAVVSLALGIGANTTIFSIIYASLLRPLPYPDLNRRVVIFTTALNSPQKSGRDGATTADFLDWRAQGTMLEDWHMFSFPGSFTATGVGLPERITTQSVTPGLLDSLGVRPVIGRFFRPGEDSERPALISEGYWRRRFGGQSDVLGRRLTIDGEVYTIIGVVLAGFELFDEPSGVDFWNTINLSPGSMWLQRRVPWLLVTAKLKPGVSLQQAQSELGGIAANLAQAYPETNRYRGVAVTPLSEARSGSFGLLSISAVRSGGVRAAHRVHERGEPSAGARHGAPA